MPKSVIPSTGKDGNFYLNAGDARISMVDTRDVAAAATVVLTETGHTGGYDLTGPEALFYHDVAAKLSAGLAQKITYVGVPDDAVRASLLGRAWMSGSQTRSPVCTGITGVRALTATPPR